MKYKCWVSWFPGIDFDFQEDFVIMSQTEYCERMPERFNMCNCKAKASSCDSCH